MTLAMSRLEVIGENLPKARQGFLDLLASRVIQKVSARFDSIANQRDLSDPKALAGESVRYYIILASIRLVLIRLGEARADIKVRFGPDMRINTECKVYIAARVPEERQNYPIYGWNHFIAAIIDSAHSSITQHGWTIQKKEIWGMVNAIVGNDVLWGLRNSILGSLAAYRQKLHADKAVQQKVAQFYRDQKDAQLQKLREWLRKCISTEVLSKEDFMMVYDELLVGDVVDS